MDRRKFIQGASLLAGSLVVAPSIWLTRKRPDEFVSVLGPIAGDALGVTLIHEHIMADFIGAKETGAHRYNPDEIVKKALPFLLALKQAGCDTFIDCTPVYLGRDVKVLKRLATASGLNIFTTTGYYGAMKEKFLPAHAYTETAEQLAARWIAEAKHGIEGTDVYPGLIKTSVDAGPLTPIYKKLLTAVAITHRQTGLSISAHTGNGEAAMQELDVLQSNGVRPNAFRWVHAHLEHDKQLHLKAARMGAWIEFDGINGSEPDTLTHHIECVKFMKQNGLLNKVLISQDAGWYWVGEPDGGTFRGYTAIFEQFIPELRKEGFTENEIRQLLVVNPRESLRLVRR
jgi:predicted metal-dependent phosphotriesterase family hydrolase